MYQHGQDQLQHYTKNNILNQHYRKLPLVFGRMKKLLLTTLTTIVFLNTTVSFACKDPKLGEKYPISSFKEYDCIVIVKIKNAVHSDKSRYKSLISFEATVLENIKGELDMGESFFCEAKKEEARAACPVHLVEGGTYLLLLSKKNERYFLSRFSFPVKSDYKYFNNYITQIKEFIQKE